MKNRRSARRVFEKRPRFPRSSTRRRRRVDFDGRDEDANPARVRSEGMVLCACSPDHTVIKFVEPPKDAKPAASPSPVATSPLWGRPLARAFLEGHTTHQSVF